jgi:hypothetical protein
MWNTGCRMIGNALDFGINILDGENPGLAITIASKASADFNSVIFPWCNNSEEVMAKAFRVSNINLGSTNPFLFLFQEYKTKKICWSLASEGPWDKRMVINDGMVSASEQVPMSNIDIFIQADRVWGLPASNNNQVFQQVLGTVSQIAGAVGTIAQAGAGIAAAAAALQQRSLRQRPSKSADAIRPRQRLQKARDKHLVGSFNGR